MKIAFVRPRLELQPYIEFFWSLRAQQASRPVTGALSRPTVARNL